MSLSRAWILAPLLLGALAVFVGWRLTLLGRMPRMLTQMAIDADVDWPVTISPDGRTIAYAETFGDDVFVHVHDVDDSSSRRLAGTEGADQLFFSPDGGWVGFEAGGALKKVPVLGGEVEMISAMPSVFGARWLDDGSLVVGTDTGIIELGSDGARRQVTRVAESERAHRYPQRLPGTDWIVFDVWTGSDETATVEAVSASTGSRLSVLSHAMMPRYATTGHLLFLREGSLWAVPLDSETVTPTGDAFLAVTEADQGYELSNDGTLVVGRSGRGDGPTLVSVMIHWHEELRRLTHK